MHPIFPRITAAVCGITGALVTCALTLATASAMTVDTAPEPAAPDTASAPDPRTSRDADPMPQEPDGLRAVWDFDNVEPGARQIPASHGAAPADGQLFGDGVDIIADPDELFGNVLSFGDDSSSYMRIDHYLNTSDDVSLSLWYRYDPDLDPNPSTSTVLLQQDGDGRSLLTLRPNGQYHTYANGLDVLSRASVPRGDWQHVTVAFDQHARTVRFYINGVPDGEQALGAGAVDQITDLLIGTHKQIGNTDPHSMRGAIDDIRVYGKALTDDEALCVYARQGVRLARRRLENLVSTVDAMLDEAASNGQNNNETLHALRSARNDAAAALADTDGTSLAAIQQAFDALTQAVAEYHASTPIDLTIDATTVERTIDSASMFGVNHRYAYNGYGTFDPNTMRVKDDFRDLYRQAGFGSIRYPGGTVSNVFDWKSAIGPREQRIPQIHGFYDNPGQGGIDPNLGPDEMAQFADEIGSQLVYVYGLGRGNAQDAADLVEYLNAPVGANPNGGIDWALVRSNNGHPEPYHVRFFEIGNEMNQAWPGSDGTASQGYWTTAVDGGSEQAYVEGGTAHFDKQYAVRADDWNSRASVSDGSAGLVRYMRYANRNPQVYGKDGTLTDDPSFMAVDDGSVSVWVGEEPWRTVTDLSGAGPDDHVVQVDYSTGALRFGDGVHGARPAAGQQILVSYSVARDGFIAVSQAIRTTAAQIDDALAAGDGADGQPVQVYASYESEGFIDRMAKDGADEWYDGMVIHPYSGTPSGDTDDEWYDDAMLKAETAGIDRVRHYVDLMPDGKVPVISEYGIFRDTRPLVRAQTHALYIAKVAMEYVRLGSPYIEKHCLVDWYTSGADALGPTQQAVIQAVPGSGADLATGTGDFQFLMTPSAYALQMLSAGTGDAILPSALSDAPTLDNGASSLSAMASRSDDGSLHVAVNNVDRVQDRQMRIVTGEDLTGRTAEIQLLSAPINAENTPEQPDTVQPATQTMRLDRHDPIIVIPAHTFAVISITHTGAGHGTGTGTGTNGTNGAASTAGTVQGQDGVSSTLAATGAGLHRIMIAAGVMSSLGVLACTTRSRTRRNGAAGSRR